MSATRLWGVMPAAGSGQRFGASKPKQYLTLVDRPVIQHSIEALLSVSELQLLVVAIAADDTDFALLDIASDSRVRAVTGGRERAESVQAGLAALAGHAADEDWVLVHDAARPLLRSADARRLVDTLWDDELGGLLATPVADTLKRTGDDGNVDATVLRDALWSAQTPQMFRYRRLRDSLHKALSEGVTVTDESMAMELVGYRPRLVEGAADNFKITRPAQLELAAMLKTAACG